MRWFEWDEAKAWSNERKHRVSFEDAAKVFDDPYALMVQDRCDSESSELRWQAIGLVEGAAVLLVAHTIRDDDEAEVIRLISARRATRKERERYEQNRAQEIG